MEEYGRVQRFYKGAIQGTHDGANLITMPFDGKLVYLGCTYQTVTGKPKEFIWIPLKEGLSVIEDHAGSAAFSTPLTFVEPKIVDTAGTGYVPSDGIGKDLEHDVRLGDVIGAANPANGNVEWIYHLRPLLEKEPDVSVNKQV